MHARITSILKLTLIMFHCLVLIVFQSIFAVCDTFVFVLFILFDPFGIVYLLPVFLSDTFGIVDVGWMTGLISWSQHGLGL